MTLPVNTLVPGPQTQQASSECWDTAPCEAGGSKASRVLGTCFFSFPVDAGESALQLTGLPIRRARGCCLPAAPPPEPAGARPHMGRLLPPRAWLRPGLPCRVEAPIASVSRFFTSNWMPGFLFFN